MIKHVAITFLCLLPVTMLADNDVSADLHLPLEKQHHVVLEHYHHSLDELTADGFLVDPEEQSKVEDAYLGARAEAGLSTEAIQKELYISAKTNGTNFFQSDEYKALEKKATEFFKEQASKHGGTLYEGIQKEFADLAGKLGKEVSQETFQNEMAGFLHKHLLSKDAPADPVKAKFLNEFYQEQGVVNRALKARVDARKDKLAMAHKFQSIADGMQKIKNLKQDLENLQAEAEKKIRDKFGLSAEEAEDLKNGTGKLIGLVEKLYESYEKAEKAGQNIADLPPVARNGLKGLSYIQDALQAGAEMDVPGISDVLSFYADATSLGDKAAEAAIRFKSGHGEHSRINQALTVYTNVLEKLDADSATMSDFGKMTGIKVIRSNKDGKYYFVTDKYRLVENVSMTEADLALMKEIFYCSEKLRASKTMRKRGADVPMITAEQLALAVQSFKATGKPIVGGETYPDMLELQLHAQAAIEAVVNQRMRDHGATFVRRKDPPPSPTPGTPRSKLTVIVRNKETGEPMAGALVLVVPGGKLFGRQLPVDEAGKAVFEGLLYGRYRVFVKITGQKNVASPTISITKPYARMVVSIDPTEPQERPKSLAEALRRGPAEQPQNVDVAPSRLTGAEKGYKPEQGKVVVTEGSASIGLVGNYVARDAVWGTAFSYPVKGPGRLRMDITYASADQTRLWYDDGHGPGGLKWWSDDEACAKGAVEMPRLLGRINGKWGWREKVETYATLRTDKAGTIKLWAWPAACPARKNRDGTWTDDLIGSTHTHALGGTMNIKFTFTPAKSGD